MDMTPDLKDYKPEVGDSLPEVWKPPISRTTLALFCGASNDHNPIHIDIDAARAAGLPDVIAQGMLAMAYLGQVLTNWVTQTAIRSFESRFLAVINLGDEIASRGEVTEIEEAAGERLVTIKLAAVNQSGEVKLSGQAVVALPPSTKEV
jgi:acyl dehydratase